MSRLANFARRNALAGRKALWRALHDYSPNAKAIYVFGAQRSGTTLLLECLDRSLEFAVLGESSDAMVNFRIKSNEFIRRTVTTSRHRFVVFKPLTDSHRVRELLSLVPNSMAIWAFRRVEDRVNSSVAKFGDHNLRVLEELSRGEGLDRWQAQGLTDSAFNFIRGFDYSQMTPHDASALFWYLRNSLYFTQNLHELSSVLPLAYEDLASAPSLTIQRICRLVGAEFDPRMTRTVHAQSIGRSESRLSREIASLCGPLYERLYEIQAARFGAPLSATGHVSSDSIPNL